MFIPKNEIQWKKVKYLKEPLETTDEAATWKYELWLNEPLASWDVFSYWEKQRVASMEKHLKKGDVLFDIGTEQGWCDLVYAKIVGPENMVLVEPTPEFWPNIKALWEKNFSFPPLACYAGFFSNVTKNIQNPSFILKGFPDESNGDLIDRNSYKNLSDPSHTDFIRQITIDDFVKASGVIPTALTIDVEGAEFLVLQGAKETLKRHDLKVWVSEHDDLAQQQYGYNTMKVAAFMKSLGYKWEVLAEDHERHVFYVKR